MLLHAGIRRSHRGWRLCLRCPCLDGATSITPAMMPIGQISEIFSVQELSRTEIKYDLTCHPPAGWGIWLRPPALGVGPPTCLNAQSRRYGRGPAGSPLLRKRAQISKYVVWVGNCPWLAVVRDGMRNLVIASRCRGPAGRRFAAGFSAPTRGCPEAWPGPRFPASRTTPASRSAPPPPSAAGSCSSAVGAAGRAPLARLGTSSTAPGSSVS